MNDLEIEFNRWRKDFEEHGTFKPVKNTSLKCGLNEFVFYYNPTSSLIYDFDEIGMPGAFFITNQSLVFVFHRNLHELSLALKDVDVTLSGDNAIRIIEDTTPVYVKGNGRIMYTLIGLLKKRMVQSMYVRVLMW